MCQPGPILPPIDTEPFQPLLDVSGERPSPARVVLENEHPDAPRLAVAQGREPDLPRVGGSVTQNTGDRSELA